MGCAASTAATPQATPQQETNGSSNAAAVDAAPAATATTVTTDPSNAQPDAQSSDEGASANEAMGTVLSTASVGLALADTASTVLGGLLEQPDGSFSACDVAATAMDLASPLLRRVLSKVVFGLSSVAKECQAAKVACLILESVYAMYNSSANKPAWTAEFMCFLKIVEAEVTQGRAEFRQQGFIALLETELRATQTRLQIILERGAVASFVFAMADEATLQECRLAIEALKQQALQGMMTEVKQDTAATKAALQRMVEDLQRKQAQGFVSDSPLEKSLLRSMAHLDEERKLKGLLGLLENEAEIAHLTGQFQLGTRREMLDQFQEWTAFHTPAAPASTPAATADDGSASSSPPAPSSSSARTFVEAEDRVFWIASEPGIGKTSLASVLCTRFADNIGASNFCFMPLAHDATSAAGGGGGGGGGVRAIASQRNDPFAIAKSLMLQLTQRVPAYRAWLLEHINKNPDNLLEKLATSPLGGGSDGAKYASVKKLLEDLLVRPMHAIHARFLKGDLDGMPACVLGAQGVVRVVAPPAAGGEGTFAPAPSQVELLSNGPRKLLILVDSLEQSHAPPATSNGTLSENDLVRVLADLAPKLPPWLGFVLTSRLEDRVLHGLAKYRPRVIEPASASNLGDLEVWLRWAVAALLGDDVGALEECVAKFLASSEGMWLYAVKLLFPLGRPAQVAPVARSHLDRVATDDMGAQYWLPMLQQLAASLSTADSRIEGASWEQCAVLVRQVCRSRGHELTVDELQQACEGEGLESGLFAALLSRLRSILPLRTADQHVHIVHASLRDWLTDSARQMDDEEALFYIEL